MQPDKPENLFDGWHDLLAGGPRCGFGRPPRIRRFVGGRDRRTGRQGTAVCSEHARVGRSPTPASILSSSSFGSPSESTSKSKPIQAWRRSSWPDGGYAGAPHDARYRRQTHCRTAFLPRLPCGGLPRCPHEREAGERSRRTGHIPGTPRERGRTARRPEQRTHAGTGARPGQPAPQAADPAPRDQPDRLLPGEPGARRRRRPSRTPTCPRHHRWRAATYAGARCGPLQRRAASNRAAARAKLPAGAVLNAATQGMRELLGFGDPHNPLRWDPNSGLWGGYSSYATSTNAHPAWWQSAVATWTLVRYLEATGSTDPAYQDVLDRTFELNVVPARLARAGQLRQRVHGRHRLVGGGVARGRPLRTERPRRQHARRPLPGRGRMGRELHRARAPLLRRHRLAARLPVRHDLERRVRRP